MSGAPSSLAAVVPGTLIDFRFEVDRLVGSGGMGAVFRVRDRHRGGIAALKLLNRPVESSIEMERFVREATILSELHHPGIVSYVAHGIAAEGWPFLAMEWLAGENLAERLQRGPLSIPECLTLSERVASALALAHQRNIIHRDIKPSNLFLRDGQIANLSLIDFGIARRIFGARPLTRTGALVGTPAYMAPEQARGERQLGPGADVFALGCVLYECLTGQPPFQGQRAIELLARLLHDAPSPPRPLRRDVPPELEALVLSMLAKDPAERPKDAAAVLAATAVLRGDPTAGSGAPERAEPKSLPVVSNKSQQVMCVVAANLGGAAHMDLATLAADGLPEMPHPLPQEALPPPGAEVVWLADGTLLATLTAGGEVVDLAEQAASYALSLKQLWPGAQVAMTSGTGMLAPTLPAGKVIGMTLKLLERAGEAISLDRASAELLADRFVIREVADGLTLQGRHPTADGQTDPSTGLLPFVGRQRELELITAWLTGKVEDGTAGTALVIGPAGIGKSRLIQELLGSKAASALHLVAKTGPEVMLALGPNDGWATLRSECAVRPILLVVDDLQAADERAVQRLDAALRALSEVPLLALVTGRPEARRRFPQLLTAQAQEFVLRPLGLQSSEALIRKVLGPALSDSQLRQITRAAAGNPRRLRWLLRAAKLNEEPPAAFLLDLQAQLLRLGPQSGRILRAASLLGDGFTADALRELLGWDPGNLEPGLRELRTAGLLDSSGAPPATAAIPAAEEYRFAAPLIREAAFRLLSPQERELAREHRLLKRAE